jgi:CubicO group peptidase (beta-lactamase class C family)
LPPLNNIDSSIQIKQLLNHTSGIFDFTTIIGYADSIMTNPNREFTPSEVIGWVEPPLFPAGANSSYSNSNYVLAGMTVEIASGQTLEEFVRDSILTPNSLTNTFFPIAETVVGNIAHPWQDGIDIRTNPRISLLSDAWSAGAIYSTSEDMNNWYRYLFSNQILNSNSITEMTTFIDGYGLGIHSLNLVPGRAIYGHGGSIQGYRSMMLYDEHTEAVVCVLINQNPAPAPLVAKVLLETLIYETPVLGITDFNKNSYLRVYPNPTNGKLNIMLDRNCNQIEISLSNSTGKKVLIEKNKRTIDISHLAEGIYIVKVNMDGNFNTKKIIKIE